MKKIISFVTLLTLGATTVSYASIDKNLKYGQRDKEVTELQEFLIDKGILKTTPSNYFGLLTFKAVKAYQTSVGVSPTGFVGALTREKINKEIDTEIASSNEAEKAESGSSANQKTNTNPVSQVVTNNTPASSSDSIYDTDVKYDSLGRKIIITQSPNYKVVDYVVANLVDSNGKLVSGFFYKYKKLFVSNDEINSRNTQTQNVQPTPTVVNDVCKNIEGTQSYIPSGMYTDASGNCLNTQNTNNNQNTNLPPASNNTTVSTNKVISMACKMRTGAPSQVVGGGNTFGGLGIVGCKATPVGLGIGTYELTFAVVGTDAISSFSDGVSSVPVVNNSVTIKVSNTKMDKTSDGYDLNVGVQFNCFKNTSLANERNCTLTNNVTGVTYSLVSGKFTDSNNISVPIDVSQSIPTNPVTVSASEISVSLDNRTENPLDAGCVNIACERDVARFQIGVNNQGKVTISSLAFSVSVPGVINPELYDYRLVNVSDMQTPVATWDKSSLNPKFTFFPDAQISSGSVKRFIVWAKVKGTLPVGVSPSFTGQYIESSLVPSSFVWKDVVGGNVTQDGNAIMKFPTNTFSTAH